MDQKSDANKALVRRFVEEVKNKRHLEQMGDIFRADYREHNATVSSFGAGIDGYKRFLTHLFTAFPEDQVTIGEIVADDDMVVYRATETGTHKAEFLGIPVTGKSATWTEIQFFKIQDGKVVEHSGGCGHIFLVPAARRYTTDGRVSFGTIMRAL